MLSPIAQGAKATDSERRLDRALEELVRIPGGPPGAISVVQRGEKRSVHRAGVANTEFATPIGLNQRLRLASVSKAFSGAVALQLVERGKLRLDQGAREELPWLPEQWAAATLRTALQHTSGLPDYTADPDFLAAFAANPKRSFTHEQLIGYIADEPLRFPPGTSYRYSNTDNIVIALIAEAAARQSYERLLQNLVFRPLGLRRTLMPFGFTLPQPFAHGYVYDGPGAPPEDVSEVFSVSGVWASGGLVSTPGELNEFIRAYAGSDLLGKAIRRQQRRFVENGASDPPGPGANAAGLALFRYRTRCGTVLGHTGSFPGYTQFAAATADGRRSATLSINLQITDGAGPPGGFEQLRDAFELAVCAARPGKDRL